MEENRLDILIPSSEHIEELKKKGIDIELELTRVVYDNLRLIKADKSPRKLGFATSKAWMDEIQKRGINEVEEMCAAKFKEELHRILMDEKE